MLGIPKGMWDGYVDRSERMFENPSPYNIINEFSFGTLETVEAFVAPEDPLSKEHLLAAISLFTRRTGGGKPKSPSKPRLQVSDVETPEIRAAKIPTASGTRDWLEDFLNKGTGKFSEIVKQGQKMPKHIEMKNKTNLPGKEKPNSSADLLNPDGTVKQRRYYDEKGRAKEDIDFNHSDDGTHTFPHRHKWDWSKKPPRQKPD